VRISASATPGTAPVSKAFRSFGAAKVNFGNTGVGTSAYIGQSHPERIVSAVKINMVKGYPGQAPTSALRSSGASLTATAAHGPACPTTGCATARSPFIFASRARSSPACRRRPQPRAIFWTDPKKRDIFNLLTASAVVGRPYIAPKGVPADRLAALRAAFDATMKDPEFLADTEKQHLAVTPMTGAEVETFIKDLYRTAARHRCRRQRNLRRLSIVAITCGAFARPCDRPCDRPRPRHPPRRLRPPENLRAMAVYSASSFSNGVVGSLDASSASSIHLSAAASASFSTRS